MTPSSPPVAYQSGVLGHRLFLFPPPYYTRRNNIDISAGGAINSCEGEVSLFFPLALIGVYGQLGARC